MTDFSIVSSSVKSTAQSISNQYGTSGIIIAAVALVLVNIVLLGLPLYYLTRGGSAKDKNNDDSKNKKAKGEMGNDCADVTDIKTNDLNTTNKSNNELRNVFSVKQKPPATGAKSKREGETTQRPFGSSYYYAHNNPNSKGGYKDGLRAEDYVMNGPRLLSKGGVRVGGSETCEGVDDDSSTNASNDNTSVINETEKCKNENTKQNPVKAVASTPITRYLWDDDSDGNIAKIHIDTLPVSSSKTISWEEGGITKENVEARLIGENNEGLLVRVSQSSGSNTKKYHLHVSKMYGEAESVKAIVKKHKLLIKITKKRVSKRYSKRHSKDSEGGVWGALSGAWGMVAGGDDENKEKKMASVSWPRLSASSVGGLGARTEGVDDKLFRLEDDGDYFDLE